tara:strand:- start:428 stop:778 length:351 start_codon:yes stop_codon:yes gene_type:complete
MRRRRDREMMGGKGLSDETNREYRENLDSDRRMNNNSNSDMRRWAASEALKWGAGLAAPVVKPIAGVVGGAVKGAVEAVREPFEAMGDRYEDARTERDERIGDLKEDLDFFSMFRG